MQLCVFACTICLSAISRYSGEVGDVVVGRVLEVRKSHGTNQDT